MKKKINCKLFLFLKILDLLKKTDNLFKMKKNFDFPSFTNENVSNFMKFVEGEDNIKIVSSKLDNNLKDIQLSRKMGEKKEEIFFMSDSKRKNLRRGSSVYQLKNLDFVIARKGLQKFFSLEYNAINTIEVEEKNKSMVQNIIFKEIRQAFEDKYEVLNFFFIKIKVYL